MTNIETLMEGDQRMNQNYNETKPYTCDELDENDSILNFLPADGCKLLDINHDTHTYTTYPILGFVITKTIREHNQSWFTWAHPISMFGKILKYDGNDILFPDGTVQSYEEPIYDSIEAWAQAKKLPKSK
jgi:hypothetical protein